MTTYLRLVGNLEDEFISSKNFCLPLYDINFNEFYQKSLVHKSRLVHSIFEQLLELPFSKMVNKLNKQWYGDLKFYEVDVAFACGLQKNIPMK